MKMLQVTYGNVPSRWAHTVQMMKMAEAFSRQVDDFRVVTQAHWSRWFRPRFNYQKFYGLASPVRVVHLYARAAQWGPVVDYVSGQGFAERAIDYALRGRFDLVYTRTPSVARACVERGLPAIVECHSETTDRRFPDLLAASGEPAFLGLVTISNPLRDRYAAAGIDEQKMLVWPDAVDLDSFDHLPGRSALRRRLGLPPGGLLATYCGHLYEHRGVEEILAAAARLPQVQFVLVGGWERDVEARRREAARLANVRFTGFVDNRLVPAYLAASDLLLMPYSRHCRTVEQMSPLKMFEYMAAGRPIIASDFPAVRAHLRHAVNALLIPSDDAEGLAAAIDRLARSPKLAESIARQAQRDVRPFTWERRATQILDRFVHRRTALARPGQSRDFTEAA